MCVDFKQSKIIEKMESCIEDLYYVNVPPPLLPERMKLSCRPGGEQELSPCFQKRGQKSGSTSPYKPSTCKKAQRQAVDQLVAVW
jgi:hypothetical protein